MGNRTTVAILIVASIVTACAGGLLGYTLAGRYPPSSPSTHVRWSSVAVVHPGVFIEIVTAPCNVGETLVGGGYRITTSYGSDPNVTQLTDFHVYTSMPWLDANGNARGWEVRWESSNATSPDLRVVAFAVCEG